MGDSCSERRRQFLFVPSHACSRPSSLRPFQVKMFGGPMCGVASNSMRREQQRYFNRMADSLRRREEANMRSESKASVEECQENMNWSDRVLSSIRSWASQKGLA